MTSAATESASRPSSVARMVERFTHPSVYLGVLSLAAVIAAYWFVATRPGVNPALVPTPVRIGQTFIDLILSGELLENTLASLQRVLLGFACGAGLAIVLGCLAGWFRFVGYILNPLIDAIRPVPALAYIPLVIVWVGIGEPSRIIIITLAVFKPCVVNARAGMKEVTRIYVEAARTLGASSFRVFWTVALPSAVPYLIAGMRTALSTGFLALVAAELIAAPSGLGFMIQNAGQYFRTDIAIVGIIVIGIVGSVLDQIAKLVGEYLTSWAEVHEA